MKPKNKDHINEYFKGIIINLKYYHQERNKSFNCIKFTLQ